MTASDVQQDVQRFTGDYFARVGESADALLESVGPVEREHVLRRLLSYNASALDIATGPVPGINLLDMLVFVSLTQAVYKRYWLPKVFGEAGAPLAEALRKSEEELWDMSEKLLRPSQQEHLRDLIRTWLSEHPDQTRVESVRLNDFVENSGDVATVKKASGILASVKSASRAADEAILLGERTFFFAQRAPFLMRLQARLGVQEVVSDSMARVHELTPLLPEIKVLRPAIQELSQLSLLARQAAEEARRLTEAVAPLASKLEPLLTKRESADGELTALEQTLGSATHLTETSLLLVRELHEIAQLDGGGRIRAIMREADRLMRHWLLYLVLLGAAWAALFWGGYYIVKRTLG